MAYGFEHAAHLTVAPLAQHHFDDRLRRRLPFLDMHDAHVGWLRALAVERDALAQAIQRFGVGDAAYTRLVRPLEPVARVHQAFGETAVVGEDEQPVRVVVEASHGIEIAANAGALEQLDHSRAMFGIAARAHIAARLVHQEVTALGPRQPAAVHADVVGGRVGARAKLAHGFAVHHHAAVDDQLLGGPPRGDACFGDELLKADALISG